MLENIISDFIEQQFPEIYREEGPFFVQFLTEYYKWMEEDTTSPIYNARAYLKDHDIDTTVDDFIIYYKEKYLKNIQINTATNTKELIKNASSLYAAKGTENAIKLFFDLIFSAESEVYYPGTDVFRLSDAKWSVPRYLEITSTPLNRLLVGRTITGVNSNATAFVEKLVRRNVNKNYIEVLYISAISGIFQTGEIIRLSSSINENYDANPVVTGSLTQLDVIDGGDGFAKGEEVTLKSTTGSEGKALVRDLATITGIVDFTLEDGGWGYTVNTDIFVSSKVLQLSNVHIVSTSNTSLADKITTIVQPMANVQWYNNTAAFGVGNTVYNYYANGLLIGVNTIISAEYGTNATSNFFLLNTLSGNNYMDPAAPYYRTAGNTASFQIQSAGWVDETATGTTDGMSANVLVYCIGSSDSFVANDVAYQVSSNNQVYANCTVRDISTTGINTFTLKVAGLNGLFLTNQPLISATTNTSVTIDSLAYDIGVHAVTNAFHPLVGNYIHDTANTSQWNATILRIPFGSGANTGFDSNLLYPEVVSLNTNFVRDHIDETVSSNWVNATSYGVGLNSANLTNMTLASALTFTTKTLGTIPGLKNQNPGTFYTYPPFVDPIAALVAPLNLSDFVIRLEDTSGLYSLGEEVTQTVNGAKGLIKFANTSEIHVRRLTFADRWTVGNTNASYLITGTSSGHTAYPIEVTYDIDKVAGHNAVITTKVSSSNSTVSELTVTNSGFSFVDGEEVEFTSLDGLRSGSALSTVNMQGFGSGYYKTTSGFLSDNKYLYDGYYYQDLAYEIRSPISVERYSEMLKNILHVLGTQVFAAIRKRVVNVMSLDSISTKQQALTPAAPANTAPVNIVPPMIVGDQALGSTLTTDPGTWA
jgi:hypothetical protein